MTDESHFNLRDLNDHKLTAQNHDDLHNGLKDEIVEPTHMLLDRGRGAEKAPNDALAGGVRIVGIEFRDGFVFALEALTAANAVRAEMETLRPLLAQAGTDPIGRVVGTDACCREAAIAIENAKDTIAARCARARRDTRRGILIIACVARTNRVTAVGRAPISALPA